MSTLENCRNAPIPWSYPAPSVRRLIAGLYLDRAAAITLRKLIHGTLHPEKIPGERPYHSAYPWPERVMSAIGRLIGGHGVEAVFHDSFSCMKPTFEYVNMGDTYNTTVVYDYTTNNFKLTCWGDMVEAMERKGYKSE